MKMTSYAPGTPSWVDIGVADIDAAAAVYGELFGWDASPGPEEAGGYRMCMLRGEAVAGLGPQMNPGPPVWNTYFSVADADATTAAVVAAGGQVIVEPMDVMGFGRMAVLCDDTGAFFSVWQPMLHIGAGLLGEPGTRCWSELLTRDPERAAKFYGSVFGWKARVQTEPAHYIHFELDGSDVAGMLPMGPEFGAEIPTHWLVYFAVDDTAATVATLERLGGKVLMGPADIPPGCFAVVAEPSGATFAVLSAPRS